MSTKTQSVLICACSKNQKQTMKIMEKEIALIGKVIRKIERKFLPKNMKHADIVILAEMNLPCPLTRLGEMAKLMGRINNRIDESGICWYSMKTKKEKQ